jgi:hypothetical protein
LFYLLLLFLLCKKWVYENYYCSHIYWLNNTLLQFHQIKVSEFSNCITSFAISNHKFLYSLILDASHDSIFSRPGSTAPHADRCCEWLCRAGWLQVSFKLVLHTPGISWLRAIFPFNYRSTLKKAIFLMQNFRSTFGLSIWAPSSYSVNSGMV